MQELTNAHIQKGLQQGFSLFKQKKIKDALALIRQLSLHAPEEPRVWSLLCDIYYKVGDYNSAIDTAQKITELQPANIRAYLQLAKCLVVAGRKVQAINALDKSAELGSMIAEENDAVGSLFSLCDEPEKAEPFLEKAVDLDPGNATYLSNLALVQRMMGKLEAAERNFDRCIDLNPKDYKAYYSRSDLKRWTRENSHIKQMEDVVNNGLDDWRGETAIRFALTKEYEDIGDYAQAFNYLKSACDLQRKHTVYDVDEDIAAIDHIIATQTKEVLAGLKQGHQSEEPVFVLGLPRTGTTLIERILSSHSAVYSAGELNNFQSELIRLVQGQYLQGKQKYTKKEFIEKALTVDTCKLGENYISSTRPRTGHTSRFIDKLPLNYLYCGIIHAALPQAKIVMLNRHPMDTCFSVYRMMFMGIYPFSYNLLELGKYYLAFRRLKEHWAATLGDAIKVVSYDEFVQDSDSQIRKLIEFCNLDWEEECLLFHQNKSASTTASAVQVRQPIYTSSVNKWKRYEKELEPLITFFKDQGYPEFVEE